MNKIKEILTLITDLNIIDFNLLIDLLENFYSVSFSNDTISLENSSGIQKTENDNSNEIIKSIKEIEVQIKTILPDKKISVLKIVKSITGLGLRETKEALDNLPFVVKKTTDNEESNKLKLDLENAGAVVVLN